MSIQLLVSTLKRIETRCAPENMVFLRPNGAITALIGIMESKKVDIDVANALIEDIELSIDDVDRLLWTVPQSRSFFRKMIVHYLNESQQDDDLLEGFLKYFQKKPMPNSLKNKLSIHLSENSTGLDSALKIWSKLHCL